MSSIRVRVSLSCFLIITVACAMLLVVAPLQAEACGGVIAERAMYFEYNGIMGGHCSLGVGE